MDRGAVDLYWLPLGAGDAFHCVRFSGRAFEAVVARRQHRPACDLYHSALQVHLGGDRYVIEMAPVWSSRSQTPVQLHDPAGRSWGHP